MAFKFEVVGESHHIEELRQVTRLKPYGEVRMESHAWVELEDDNPYDPNAVRVSIDGLTVGHFSRYNASQFRQFLREQRIIDRKFEVACLIVGSHTAAKGYLIGVFLDIEITVAGGLNFILYSRRRIGRKLRHPWIYNYQKRTPIITYDPAVPVPIAPPVRVFNRPDIGAIFKKATEIVKALYNEAPEWAQSICWGVAAASGMGVVILFAILFLRILIIPQGR